MDTPGYRQLKLLTEVYDAPDVTQRDLSRRLGIALGLTNALMRNLAQKGYIRVTRARWQRRLYALTPKGFTRKVQLTVSYIQRFLGHYQTIRQTLRQELAPLELHAESRVAIFGTGELAELVYLGLREAGIEEIDIYAPSNPANGKFLGARIRDVEASPPTDHDRVIIAALDGVEEKRAHLRGLGIPQDRIVSLLPGATEDSNAP
jgi:DNA-binding MarR family transcriptional regulator